MGTRGFHGEVLRWLSKAGRRLNSEPWIGRREVKVYFDCLTKGGPLDDELCDNRVL